MNRYEVAAMARFVLGRLQEDAGKLVGNRRLENAGYSMQFAARSRKAIVEAERLIKRCNRKKREPGHSAEVHGMLCDINMTN